MNKILIIGVLIVVAILVSAFVAVPYLTRANDYANNPDDPPEDVEDPDSPPDWQCRFIIDVKCTVPHIGWTDIEIKDMDTNLEKYEGDPFDMFGWPAGFTRPESVTVTYELYFIKGLVMVPPDGPDKSNFKVYKDDNYEGSCKTNWFFWWSELEGNWEYTLKVKYGDQVDRITGTFGYFADGRSVVN